MSHQRQRANLRHQTFALVLYALLIIAAIVTINIIVNEYRFSIDSDSAVPAVIARLAMLSGDFIPHTWIFANGDLWIISSRIFLTIFYPILGLTYNLIATADTLSYFYLLFCIYGVCRFISPDDQRGSLIATIIAAGCLSITSFEFVIGQGAYAIYTGLALILFALVSRPIIANDTFHSKLTRWTLTALATCGLCLTNSTRSNVTIVAPLLAGWLAGVVFRRRPPDKHWLMSFANPAIVAVLFGAIVGSALYRELVLPRVLNNPGVSQLTVASGATMLAHLIALPRAWLQYFSLAPNGDLMPPWQHVAQIFVWMFSVCLLLAPMLIVATPKQNNDSLRTFAWIALACYGVSFSALIITKDMFVDFSEIRYATFGIYASVCVIALMLVKLRRKTPKLYITMSIVICVTSIIIGPSWKVLFNPGGITYSDRINLINVLKTHDVGTFVATYWNSYVISVLTGGEVEGYPVTVNYPSGVQALSMNSPTTLVYGGAGINQAVVLTRAESKGAIWDALQQQLGDPSRALTSGPFDIRIYHKNVGHEIYGDGTQFNSAVDASRLGIRLSRDVLPRCAASEPCIHYVSVTNTGTVVLATTGTRPFRLGIEGVDDHGSVVSQDAGRADFGLPLEPGRSEQVGIAISPNPKPEISSYRICLLQELVAWRCDRTEGATAPVNGTSRSLRYGTPRTTERLGATIALSGEPTITANGNSIQLHVLITNDGKGAFGSDTPPRGVNLGAHAIDATGAIVDNDLSRARIPQIAPGGTAAVLIALPAEKLFGKSAEILPVAEGVGWFDKWGTRPLIVGPFHRCNGKRTTGNMVCDAAGRPLPSVRHTQR